MRARLSTLLVALAAIAATPLAGEARGNPYALEPPEVESSRAFNYALLDSASCLAELDARAFPYERLGPWRNVETPLRLSGPVRGVTFQPTQRPGWDLFTPAAIADCRLALAIDDLADVLQKRGVVRAEYLSMYRPKRGAPPGRRHPAALAIDLATVELADGTVRSVQFDFHGRVGARTCGEAAAKPTRDTPGARLWREIACELGDRQAFNLILTPNYDWGHRDHFHLEVRTNIRWYLVN